MKIYIACNNPYHTTHIYGVFLTLEDAKKAVEEEAQYPGGVAQWFNRENGRHDFANETLTDTYLYGQVFEKELEGRNVIEQFALAVLAGEGDAVDMVKDIMRL